MPPKRGVKSTSRKNTPVSPPKPASSAGSPKQTRRSAQGASRDDQDTERLQRGSVELSLQPVAEAIEDDFIEVAGGPVSESSSQISDSKDQLEDLDSEFIVDSLADLHRESTNIIRFFDHPTEDTIPALLEQFEDAASKTGRRFRQYLSKFVLTRESFGEDLYINSSLVVRKLRDGESWSDIPDGKWRPDAILYLANLAQLLVSCFMGAEEQVNESFQNLRSFYPQIFSSVEASSRFRTSLAESAVDFSNAFRTQYFIHEAKQHSGEATFDPDVALGELFPDTGPFSGVEIAGDILPAAVETRLREIRKFVTLNSRNPVKIGQLEKTFPWTDFLTHVVQWVSRRRQELEAQIAAQGGVDNIVDCIQDKDFTPLDADAELQTATARAALEQALPIDPQLTQGTASTGKRRGRPPQRKTPLVGSALEQEIALVKNMQSAKAARDAAAAAAAASVAEASTPGRRERPAQEIPQSPERGDGTAEPAGLDDGEPVIDEEELLRPTQLTAEVERTLAAHARESNKENMGAARQRSFLDKQTNARKVPFNETQSPEKRRRPTEGSSDDDDEFEEDQRPAKQARKGKGRARVEQVQPSTQPIRSPLRPMPALRPPPSSAPAAIQDDDGEFPLSQQWQQANAAAKMTVQAYREQNRDEKVQVRKPWSHAEVDRLMELIEINGPKYSKILQDDKNPEMYPDGPVLEYRNQVQLKDKARNIKLDFLK